jgi:sulfide:quinone oxidoreductase
MNHIKHITAEFAVSGALSADDFPNIAAMGFRSVISNLPDGELGAHLTSHEAADLARRSGLEFRYIPAVKVDIFSDLVIAGVDNALRELPSPILAHCISGQRSAMVWAAAAARRQPTDCVLARLKAAGFDLEIIRDDLSAQRDGRSTASCINAAFRDQPAIERSQR